MELTKEIFEEGLGNILEKVADVKSDMITKADLKTELETRIKAIH